MDTVPTATDHLKDDTKVQFIEVMHKADGNAEEKFEECQSKKCSVIKRYWHKRSKKNSTKKG